MTESMELGAILEKLLLLLAATDHVQVRTVPCVLAEEVLRESEAQLWRQALAG